MFGWNLYQRPFRLDSSRTEWSNYRNIRDDERFAYNTVTSIFEDSKGRVWITTQGGGFCLFNEEDETFTTFNSTNGLINDVVYQMQEDDQDFFGYPPTRARSFSSESMEFKNYNVEMDYGLTSLITNPALITGRYALFWLDQWFRPFNPTLFKNQRLRHRLYSPSLSLQHPVTPG